MMKILCLAFGFCAGWFLMALCRAAIPGCWGKVVGVLAGLVAGVLIGLASVQLGIWD